MIVFVLIKKNYVSSSIYKYVMRYFWFFGVLRDVSVVAEAKDGVAGGELVGHGNQSSAERLEVTLEM
jgi:hypothetical protein